MKNVREFLKTWLFVVLLLCAFAYPSVSVFITRLLLNLSVPVLILLLIRTVRENKRLRARLKNGRAAKDGGAM